jgi:hypothetical protein
MANADSRQPMLERLIRDSKMLKLAVNLIWLMPSHQSARFQLPLTQATTHSSSTAKEFTTNQTATQINWIMVGSIIQPLSVD